MYERVIKIYRLLLLYSKENEAVLPFLNAINFNNLAEAHALLNHYQKYTTMVQSQSIPTSNWAAASVMFLRWNFEEQGNINMFQFNENENYFSNEPVNISISTMSPFGINCCKQLINQMDYYFSPDSQHMKQWNLSLFLDPRFARFMKFFIPNSYQQAKNELILATNDMKMPEALLPSISSNINSQMSDIDKGLIRLVKNQDDYNPSTSPSKMTQQPKDITKEIEEYEKLFDSYAIQHKDIDDVYLNDNILDLWCNKLQNSFPRIAIQARQSLSVPATNAAQESVFSTLRLSLDEYNQSQIENINNLETKILLKFNDEGMNIRREARKRRSQKKTSDVTTTDDNVVKNKLVVDDTFNDVNSLAYEDFPNENGNSFDVSQNDDINVDDS